jgi:hypothetical protein
MGVVNQVVVGGQALPRQESQPPSKDPRLAARVDELTRELERTRRTLERERAEAAEARPRGLAREVLAAAMAVAAMGTVVASVAMLTAWGVATQLPLMGRTKDANDER